jgi:hypothetical protein
MQVAASANVPSIRLGARITHSFNRVFHFGIDFVFIIARPTP